MRKGEEYKPNKRDRQRVEDMLSCDAPIERVARRIGISHQTLYKHYGPLLAKAGLVTGHKAFNPNETQRKQVMLMAACGISHAEIAMFLGIAKSTLEKYFDKELKLGQIEANAKVTGNIFRMATGDPEVKSTITAAIWWTKARMGWMDTSRQELTGADGKPIQTEGQVVVMLPDNGRGDVQNPELQSQAQLLHVGGSDGEDAPFIEDDEEGE
jgi:DNA-binding CsgD family transcriptional regulator